MKIRATDAFDTSHSRFEAESAAQSIAELEAEYAAGRIAAPAYFERKQSLVRLYLRQTTSPRRRRRYEDEEPEEAADQG